MKIFDTLQKFKSTRTIVIIAIVLIAFVAGKWFGSGSPEPVMVDKHDNETISEAKAEVWTCSMHPQIRQPGPGKCPLCGMDLIPAQTDSGKADAHLARLEMSERARKLAEVETAKVERKFVPVEIRLVGKVDYDETRMKTISARFPGRLERLYVDYTGIPVKKGEHLISIYSPALIVAQTELIQSAKAMREARSSKDLYGDPSLPLNAARDKLRLWGLTAEQVAETEKQDEPPTTTTLYAPIGGIVVEKNAVEGMYVDEGTMIYKIADLRRVWVRLEAYESDLLWLRYGQSVEIENEAFPGEVYQGQISFIDPMLDSRTRTVTLRVNVPNEQGDLKPGMFVRAKILSEVSADGSVIDRNLAGKWISPMHPEIVKDGPGICDVCGMPLVKAESLGYGNLESENNPPLVIPASAPLITGKRAVVYVQTDEGVYEGREIVLGPRAGDYYVVREGLKEGERVVVQGNFKIDSALQIQAAPSMMSEVQSTSTDEMPEMAEEKLEVPEQFLKDLDAVYSAYFDVQKALSLDNADDAKSAGKQLEEALQAISMKNLKDAVHHRWMKDKEAALQIASALQGAENIQKARESFLQASELLIGFSHRYGTSGNQSVIRFHCPMAFDFQGADWLQDREGVENPYFGSTMFKCGTQEEVISSAEESR